jgi:hypothetical protein
VWDGVSNLDEVLHEDTQRVTRFLLNGMEIKLHIELGVCALKLEWIACKVPPMTKCGLREFHEL